MPFTGVGQAIVCLKKLGQFSKKEARVVPRLFTYDRRVGAAPTGSIPQAPHLEFHADIRWLSSPL
jgi:hypothetical protein